jgi:hypothetical protein
MLREVGFVGTGAYLLFVAASIWKLFHLAPGLDPSSATVFRWARSLILSLLVLSFFEINLLTFGFPTGAMIMLALAASPGADVGNERYRKDSRVRAGRTR